MELNKLTAEQKLERASVFIMRQPEFLAYSGVMMVGTMRVEDDPAKCPTAYTDGFNEVYGRKFVDSLPNEKQVRFLRLHEVIHKMYRHTTMWQHLFRKSPVLANYAADFVVNGTIIEANCSGVEMPEECIYDKELSHGKDVGEVWRLLAQKYPKLANPLCITLGSGHGNLPKGFDQHGWEEANGWSKEEELKISEQIDAAIRQGAILAGKVGGNLNRDIGELMKVRLDPWAILRQFMTDTCIGDGELSYARPNRRFLQHDMILPIEVCETMPHILLVQDTSGSIGGDDLTYGISNLVHCFKTVNPEKVTMMYVDTAVAGVEEYERGDVDKLVSSTKPAGGGGTAFKCVSEYLKKHKIQPTVIVFFTDGYTSSWPDDLGIPTAWLLYQNETCVPPYGVVAHV